MEKTTNTRTTCTGHGCCETIPRCACTYVIFNETILSGFARIRVCGTRAVGFVPFSRPKTSCANNKRLGECGSIRSESAAVACVYNRHAYFAKLKKKKNPKRNELSASRFISPGKYPLTNNNNRTNFRYATCIQLVIDGPSLFHVVAGDRKFYTASIFAAAAKRRNPKSSNIIPLVERVTCRVGFEVLCPTTGDDRWVVGEGGGGSGGGDCMALTAAELIIKVKIKPPSVWTAMTEAIKTRTGKVEYFHYNRLLFIYLHNLLFV